jgi:hypothetical protein
LWAIAELLHPEIRKYFARATEHSTQDGIVPSRAGEGLYAARARRSHLEDQMFKFVMIGTALAGLGLASVAPASAQAARPDPAVTAPSAASVTPVQFRRGWGGGGWGGRGYYGGYRRGWGGGWGGGAAGLGLGLATGAIIGGAIASQAQPYPYYGYEPAPVYEGGGGDTTAYCMSRFRSYDPGSGTYLGYDGFRHPCP